MKNFVPIKFLRHITAAALLSLSGCIIFFNGFVVCGDGILANNEECDDANRFSGDGCDELCFLEFGFCSDGLVNFNEICDDGNIVDGDGCSADCQSLEVCGDGFINPGEACDDGNNLDGDGCSANCQSLEICGDGVVNLSEQCDDGALNSNAPNACRQTCQLPVCGDDVVDAGEQCDNGTNNSDIIPGACRTNCVFRFCGDGVKDGVEQCDDGNNQSGDGCDQGCRIELLCGDGAIQAGELCDSTNFNGQSCQTLGFSGGLLSCAASCNDFDTSDCFFCGDGVINPGEECDDANVINNDACTNTCTNSIEICDNNGNNQVDEGCDDDNDNRCDSNIAKPAGVTVTLCPNTPAAAISGDDCNDNSAQIAPGNLEICDNIDNDCDDPDGLNVPAIDIDEGCDDDNDNFCDAAATKAAGVVVTTCTNTPAAAIVGDDCNDNNANFNPSAGNCP
jgi:cysteine-rich repeat protein